MHTDDNIISIKGVGEKTADLYSRLGVISIDDLIHYYPRDYVQYENTTESNDFKEGYFCAFKGTVIKKPLAKKVRRLYITGTSVNCGGVLITATWFNMPFLSKMLNVGNSYVFRGRLTQEGDHYHIEQPQVFTEEQYTDIVGKIIPVYSLTKGLTNNAVNKTMHTAFSLVNPDEYEDGLYDIHFPENIETLKNARNKLVFDEFLLFILRLRLLKENNINARNTFNIIESAYTQRIIERLPFRLTKAQEKVWNEVKNDLSLQTSMSRLVQGDVGSGKTMIAILASVMVAANGYQAAVMAPTEILAAQHYETFVKLLADNNLDIEVTLLTGSMTQANKRRIREKIESGEAKIIIGTHALIQEKVIYNKLALVVTDEQHRFGVGQREMLMKKNEEDSVHILVMSATPIPRTLAIIMYGDLSVSVIDEVPAHKLPIKNAVVGESYRKKAYEFIEKEVHLGHQVYIICPLVEESEGLNAKDVINHTKELSEIFPDTIRIGCLYGKMRPKDKQQVMDDFATGNIDILVSTTVVEVGVNVPNATVMLIENAERFGLAQLHQLRGRIGRGASQSYCIFMSGNDSEKSMERLNVLKDTNDGFKIAEEDLKQRGPGDLFGIRQSGDMQFKLADIINDAKILKDAAVKVDEILREDKNLEKEENRRLKLMLEKSYAKGDIAKTI